MNTSKIQTLSKQCCALQTFKDRCTWNDANFSVGDCLLDADTSKLINLGIREVVKEHIRQLTREIKKEAEE